MRPASHRLVAALGLLASLAVPAAGARPADLPPGTLVSITQMGCGGFGGCHFDQTTFHENGRWVRLSSNLAEPCTSDAGNRMTAFERQDLRRAMRVLHPYLAADATFIPDGGADLQEFTLRNEHGTIFWLSGAEDPSTNSGMPAEVAEAIDVVWTLVFEVTEDPCF